MQSILSKHLLRHLTDLHADAARLALKRVESRVGDVATQIASRDGTGIEHQLTALRAGRDKPLLIGRRRLWKQRIRQRCRQQMTQRLMKLQQVRSPRPASYNTCPVRLKLT